MDKQLIEPYINKRVQVILKNHFSYTGIITFIGEDSIAFIDKYKCSNTFVISQIMSISELPEARE